MRAFAHLPSKRRVAGVIAFALMVFSALGAVHDHRLGVPASSPALNVPVPSDGARAADCFVCRTLVSSRELVPHVSAPYLAVAVFEHATSADPVPTDVFQPSAPRAPPAA